MVISTIIDGLSLGGIYALIALGYTMVYGIAKLLNFAHGDIIMVGGYTVCVVFGTSGQPLVAGAAAVLMCMAFGVAIERVAYKPLRGASPLAVLITAIGISFLLQSVAQLTFGSANKMVIFPKMGSVNIGDVKIDGSTLLTLGVAAAIMVALTVFVNKTKTGRAMVAVSEDKSAATLMGISANRIIMVTFAIGSALAAVASVFLIMKAPSVSVTMGSMPGIKAFTAAVIGGIGSIPGAMLGGIVLGLIETVCGVVPAVTPYTVAIEFTLLIVILLVKPTGILGKKRREKV